MSSMWLSPLHTSTSQWNQKAAAPSGERRPSVTYILRLMAEAVNGRINIGRRIFERKLRPRLPMSRGRSLIAPTTVPAVFAEFRQPIVLLRERPWPPKHHQSSTQSSWFPVSWWNPPHRRAPQFLLAHSLRVAREAVNWRARRKQGALFRSFYF